MDDGLPAAKVVLNVPEAPEPVGATGWNPTYVPDGFVTRMLTAVPAIEPEPATTLPLTAKL